MERDIISLKLPQGRLLYSAAPLNKRIRRGHLGGFVQYDAPSDNNTAVGIICRLQNDSSGDGYDFRLAGNGSFRW